MQIKDKFIAFIDIIGFTAMVEAAEAAGGDLTRPLELAAALGSAAQSDKFKSHGPTTCPHSRFLQRDLDFQVTQISDCVVISAEVSPAGISNLTSHCFGIAMSMLSKNALCRGHITRGSIHHENGQFVGSGYVRAYKGEGQVAFRRESVDEGATPFIQIEDPVVNYVRDETDNCVRTMFGRVTDSDGTFTAIYPFKALANIPSALITADFDFEKFLEDIRRSRGFREANLSELAAAEAAAPSERAKAKVRHYMRGMQMVIDALHRKEAMIQRLQQPMGRPLRG